MSSDLVLLVKCPDPISRLQGAHETFVLGTRLWVHHKLIMVMGNKIWFLSGTLKCIDFLFMIFALVYRYRGLVLPTHSVSGRFWEPEFPWMRPTPLSLQCTTRSALPCRWAVVQTENKKKRFYLIKFLNSSSYLCSQIIPALLELLHKDYIFFWVISLHFVNCK